MENNRSEFSPYLNQEDFQGNLLKELKESSSRDRIKSEFKIMEGFASDRTYSEGEVRRDMLKVVEVENNLYRNNTLKGINKFGDKDGDNLEYLIDEKSELNNWFGDNSYIQGTLLFDDLINGVDAVLEYDTGDESSKKVALVVDCAVGKSIVNISNKVKKNIDSLTHGKTRVKYFESQVDSYKGELRCIPVVVGIDSFHTDELMDNEDNNHFLENSPAQIVFLNEIKMQLDMYLKILKEKKGGYYNEDISEIKKIKEIINDTLEEKSDLVSKDSTKKYLNKDKTFWALDVVVGLKK